MNEPGPDIRFLKRNQIDIVKWDHCITNASNSLIYAHSFYLDVMAKNWSGLVLNDYQAVMPLTWKRKFGFTYLYQPPFTAQLGLFAHNISDLGLIGLFIKKAKCHFKFCEINLNAENITPGTIQRSNYILPLIQPYSEIRKNYKKRLLENLAEAETYHLIYKREIDFYSTIRFFQREYGKRFPHVKEQDYLNFSALCNELQKKNMLIVRQVENQAGSILSSSIFFYDRQRIYNIMSVTLKNGREKRSHFLLLDQLIREFSSGTFLLDFEGSDVPGIAEFYRKFGSQLVPYYFLRYNHLPFPFRYFK
jgi:hypothetical protein